MLSEGNDMPPIELSALADGISYASSVFFAVLLYRRGMLTCGNLLRTFFAGMCAFIHFIAGPRGYAGLPFFYDWIAVDTPQSGIEVGQYVLRNLCFGAVAYPYLFLAKIFTSRRKILLTGDCPLQETLFLSCLLSGMTQMFWNYIVEFNSFLFMEE